MHTVLPQKADALWFPFRLSVVESREHNCPDGMCVYNVYSTSAIFTCNRHETMATKINYALSGDDNERDGRSFVKTNPVNT